MKYTYILIGVSTLFLMGCRNFSTSYSSNYIGIYGKIGEYLNGELPSKDCHYTGEWKSQDGRIEGTYLNGIPVGLWKSYYPNFMVRQLVSYANGGTFFNINYYPDGSMMMQQTGRYQFADNKYKCWDISYQHWDIEGKLVSRPTKQSISEGDWYFKYATFNPTNPTYGPFRFQDFECEVTYTINHNNFKLGIFLISHNPNSTLQKTIILGYLDPKSGEVTINENRYIGDYRFELSTSKIQDDELIMRFETPSLEKGKNAIVVKFPLLKGK